MLVKTSTCFWKKLIRNWVGANGDINADRGSLTHYRKISNSPTQCWKTRRICSNKINRDELGLRKKRGRCAGVVRRNLQTEKRRHGKRGLFVFGGPCEQQKFYVTSLLAAEGLALFVCKDGVSQTCGLQFRLYFWLFYLFVVHTWKQWYILVVKIWCWVRQVLFQIIYTVNKWRSIQINRKITVFSCSRQVDLNIGICKSMRSKFVDLSEVAIQTTQMFVGCHGKI